MSAYAPQGKVEVVLIEGEIPVLSFNADRDAASRASTVTSSILTTANTLPPSYTKKNYENGTYIDWAKESNPINSYNDSSYFSNGSLKWITIVISALSVGYVTTIIDLTAVWLNDLKKGICFSKIDKWSLLNPYLTCPADEWHDWSQILFHTTNGITMILIDFPIFLILSVIFCLLAVHITIRRDSRIQQSGIPELKAIISGFNYDIPGYLGKKLLAYKVIGLSLVVSSGLWLGKEGPFVHISCGLLNIIYSLVFPNSDHHEGVRRELLSAAVATGISVAFDSPIGGVLFVLEAIPSYFMPTKIMWNSFVSATIGAVVLTWFRVFAEGNNFNEGDLFQVNFGNFSWLFMEIVPFLLLGVMGGYFGYFYTGFYKKVSSLNFKQKVHRKLCQFFKVSDVYGPYLEVALVMVITAFVMFPFAMTRLPLPAYLKILFTDCPVNDSQLDTNSSNFMCLSSNPVTIAKLIYIIITGFFLSSYSFSLALPGGVLMPSLVLGASSGRLIGIISQLFQSLFDVDYLATCTETSCLVSPSSYAVVGAAAFMSGLTKLTMCVVVVMFEMTGAVTYVLPIMCSVMVLKFVNDWLCNENIYDSWLINNFNVKGDNFTPPTSTAISTLSHEGVLNKGKGNGLCQFTQLTPSVKLKLPDIPIKKVMISIVFTKCLELLPESTPNTVQRLQEFLASNDDEGYPLIVSRENPLSLGYVTRQELNDKLIFIDDNSKVVSFQITNMSGSLVSQQLRYEGTLNNDQVLKIPITTENLFLVVNDDMPLVLVLEMFEKLSLNYLIITDSDVTLKDHMSGFVDRFILSRLIDTRFESLQEEFGLHAHNISEFDVESVLENENAVLRRRDRDSIELLT